MAYQYCDRGASPQGIPDYDTRPQPVRRPPPQQGHYYPPSDRQRGPAPMRPPQQGGPPPNARYAPQPPQPQYVQDDYRDSVSDLYDGTAYGGAEEDDFETWPLPAPAFAQSGRSGSSGRGSPVSPISPRGSPRGSPRVPPPSNMSSGPRRPPQRPRRPDFQEPVYDQPRPSARVAPANRAYHQQSPPPMPSHHGSGQWTGDGYTPAAQPMPRPSVPRGPPPPHPPQSEMQMPHALQQTLYGQRNPRPPLGPPPSARRGPASYYPQIAPVHPIVEETDSMRGSIRNPSMAFDPAHSSYASSMAIPIGIPGNYVQDRGSARSFPFEHGRPSVDSRPSVDHGYDERPDLPIGEAIADERDVHVNSPSPEPPILIRQASLGKKSKPTLTTVKSGERIRREGAAQQSPSPPREVKEAARRSSELEKETYTSRPSDASLSSYDDHDEKAVEAGAVASTTAAAAPAALAIPSPAMIASEITRHRSPESVLSSGTGLLDPSDSDSDEQNKRPSRRPSKDLLAASLPKEQLTRSAPRSPLAPPDPVADAIHAENRRSSPMLPTTPDTLQVPGQSPTEPRPAKRRPPRLDMDSVRDAEARGSLTSLPDLIRRATKLASNLDRGKTASRLGMNWFVDGENPPSNDNRKSGSISDILASFQGAGGGRLTPPGSRGGVSMSRWSSNLRHSHLPSDDGVGEDVNGKSRGGRRCCGLPAWGFVLLLLLAFLLIAAAVVVPVILLVVLPDQQA